MINIYCTQLGRGVLWYWMVQVYCISYDTNTNIEPNTYLKCPKLVYLTLNNGKIQSQVKAS